MTLAGADPESGETGVKPPVAVRDRNSQAILPSRIAGNTSSSSFVGAVWSLTGMDQDDMKF